MGPARLDLGDLTMPETPDFDKPKHIINDESSRTPIVVSYTPCTIPPTDPFPAGQTAYRPYLQASLCSPLTGKTVVCRVWLDSGADHCIFSLSVAAALGLDPSQMKSHLSGAIGATNVDHFETISVKIDFTMEDGAKRSISFDTCAAFTQGMEGKDYGGVLGQLGFFENFEVMFNHRARVFSIRT